MEYLTLGKIVKVFGLKGELKIYSTSDFAAERYKIGNKVFLFNRKDNKRLEVEVIRYRVDKGMDIVTFKDLQDINLVEQFVGYEVQVEKKKEDLKDGTYYFDDLRKCDVVDENGNVLGHVKEIEKYASYNTLRVGRPNDKDFFVPFVQAFILNVNIEERKITIKVIKGLLD